MLDDDKPLINVQSLRFEPGTKFGYSNTGMLTAWLVIEKVSAVNYFGYIRQHIYQPAGMLDSDSYEMDKPISNLAIGYEPDTEKKTDKVDSWNNNFYKLPLTRRPCCWRIFYRRIFTPFCQSPYQL